MGKYTPNMLYIKFNINLYHIQKLVFINKNYISWDRALKVTIKPINLLKKI